MDGIFDNSNDVQDYWKFIVNGKDAQVGIDSFMVNAGDVIEFDYSSFTEDLHENSLLQAKNLFYKS